MKIELDFALDLIRKSAPNHYAGAIGIISGIINADYSPFMKVRNIKTTLAALETSREEYARGLRDGAH